MIRGLQLTNKAAHDGVTLFQSFTSLGWIKHQPFNSFYLFAVLLQRKTCLRSYMCDSFPFVLLNPYKSVCHLINDDARK